MASAVRREGLGGEGRILRSFGEGRQSMEIAGQLQLSMDTEPTCIRRTDPKRHGAGPCARSVNRLPSKNWRVDSLAAAAEIRLARRDAVLAVADRELGHDPAAGLAVQREGRNVALRVVEAIVTALEAPLVTQMPA